MSVLVMEKYKTTFTSFLAYFVMSAVISPIGVVSKPMAEYYDISVTAATASFTFLTTGFLAGSVIAMFVFDLAKLRTILIWCFAIVTAGSAAMYLMDNFALLSLWLFVVGLVCGINLAAAIVVITENFATNLRASMMLLTDSFYSMAGVASTFLAGYFILKGFHWSSAYVLAAGASVIGVASALLSRYPRVDRTKRANGAGPSARLWPLPLYLIGVAIIAYLIGFGTIYSWVPNYAQSVFSSDPATAGELVSRLFLGMFIGQLVMFVLVLRFDPVVILAVAAVASTILTVSLWGVDTVDQLKLSMLGLGLVTGGLFKLLVSFGTTIVETPTPRMISFLIFCAAVGTALSPGISSGIVELFDIRSALVFTSICYGLMVLVIAVSYAARRKHMIS